MDRSSAVSITFHDLKAGIERARAAFRALAVGGVTVRLGQVADPALSGLARSVADVVAGHPPPQTDRVLRHLAEQLHPQVPEDVRRPGLWARLQAWMLHDHPLPAHTDVVPLAELETALSLISRECVRAEYTDRTDGPGERDGVLTPEEQFRLSPSSRGLLAWITRGPSVSAVQP